MADKMFPDGPELHNRGWASTPIMKVPADRRSGRGGTVLTALERNEYVGHRTATVDDPFEVPRTRLPLPSLEQRPGRACPRPGGYRGRRSTFRWGEAPQGAFDPCLAADGAAVWKPAGPVHVGRFAEEQD